MDQNPFEFILCVAAALITFFFIKHDISNRKGMVWSDALGLSVFGVVGCHVALEFGAPFVIAVFMGMVTATGGGVIRDVLTNTQPMILCGQVYATAALLGSLSYASLRSVGLTEVPAEAISCGAAFALRASAIIFDIRTGPPGEFLRIGGTQPSVDKVVQDAVDQGERTAESQSPSQTNVRLIDNR